MYTHTEFYSPNLALLKAIAEEQKATVKRNTVEEDLLPATDTSSLFSRLRSPNPMVAKHGKARITVERILERARRIAENGPFPPLDFYPMLTFAQCKNASTPSDCHGEYRTHDGTCNNLNDPIRGSHNTPYRRLLPAEFEDGIYVPIGTNQSVNGDPFAGPWPSPRTVSREIVTSTQNINDRFSMLFTVYGQSIALDLSRGAAFQTTQCSQSCNISENLPFCMPILVEDDDPYYGIGTSNNGTCLVITRGIGACMTPFESTFEQPRQVVNQLTHYLDAASIYGNNAVDAAALRLFQGGQLNLSSRTDTYKGDLPLIPDGYVPSSTQKFFLAGDGRVENYVHQINVYVLWYRMHNYIVGELEKINPCWDDEKLYQEGRKIIGAIWQVIIYREYLPLLFENQFDNYIGDYSGYDQTVDATLSFAFAVGAFRFGHSMFRSSTNRLDSEGNSISAGPLNLRRAFFNPQEYFNGGGVDPLLRGMLQDQSTELDQYLSIILTTQLFPGSNPNFGSDLASRNMQRAREQGIPPYRTWQEYCENRYNVSATFMSEADADIRTVYGDEGYDNGIDLWLGGISEELLPGSNLGPTFACIIAEGFNSLRAGDRFYWENPIEFTADQRESLSQMRISKVICENADDIPNIKRSAFLAGGEQVSCSSLPFVDLSLWKDSICDNVDTSGGSDSGASTTSGWTILNLFTMILSFPLGMF